MAFNPHRTGYGRPPPHRHPYPPRQPVLHQGWSTDNATSNYSAILEADASGSSRKGRNLRAVTRQAGPLAEGSSKGIKGRDLGYAFIGKEADQYAREELREQLGSASMPPIPGDPVAPSPMTPAKVTPQMVVEEFKRAGHFDTTRKQLLSSFQSSEHKDALLQSLQTFLLKRLSLMEPESRQRLASQDDRLQHLELNRWIEDSSESADILDDMMERLRGRADDPASLFNSHGSVGKGLESRLAEVIQSEKRRIEAKGESSDDEGGESTPFDKGSATPAQEMSSRGSLTPMTAMAAAATEPRTNER